MLLTVGVFPCALSLLKTRSNFMLMIEILQFILPLITCIIRLLIFWWKKEGRHDTTISIQLQIQCRTLNEINRKALCTYHDFFFLFERFFIKTRIRILPISIKSYNFTLKDVRQIVNMILEDWLKSRNMQEKNMMIMWAQKARTVNTIVYSIMGINCACVVLLPAFGISATYTANTTETDMILPLPGYYIYNATKMSLYVFTYIGQVITLSYAVLTYTGIDTFLGLLVFHVCGQLNILTIRFSCLSKLIKFRKGLGSCIRNHVRLLR